MELDENERRLMRGAGWGMWTLGWLGLGGLSVALSVLSVAMGSDEPAMGRPFLIGAASCFVTAGVIFAAGIGRALVRGRKLD
jgi:hypothetical protein